MDNSLYTSIFPLPSNKSKIVPIKNAEKMPLIQYRNAKYGINFYYPSYLQKEEVYFGPKDIRDTPVQDDFRVSLQTSILPEIKTHNNYHDLEERRYACDNSFFMSSDISVPLKGYSLRDFIQPVSRGVDIESTDIPMQGSYFISGETVGQGEFETYSFEYKNHIYDFSISKLCDMGDNMLNASQKELFEHIVKSIKLN